MKKFSVEVMIAHTVFLEVEAETEKEAEEKARLNVIERLADYCTEMEVTAETEREDA